jgi:hypothetical protein
MCKTTRGAQASGTTALLDIDPNTAANPTPITPTFTLQQYLNKNHLCKPPRPNADLVMQRFEIFLLDSDRIWD